MSEQCGSRRHNWVCTLDKGHVDAHREYGVMLKAGWTNDEARAAREADIAAIIYDWQHTTTGAHAMEWPDLDAQKNHIREWAAEYAAKEGGAE